jgi:uncharacterized protein YndB with AHSA1/START domain
MNVNPNPLRVRIEETIPASRGDVFDAVVNAKKLVKHFANKSSGDIVERARITWDFGEFGSVELHIREVRFNSLIVFEWPASGLSWMEINNRWRRQINGSNSRLDRVPSRA